MNKSMFLKLSRGLNWVVLLVVLVLVLVLVLLVFCVKAGTLWAVPLAVDGIKIAVNEKSITKREFQLLKQARIYELGQKLSGQPLEKQLSELDRNLAQELVESLLLTILAERLSLKVSEETVERQLEAIRTHNESLWQIVGSSQARDLVVRQLLVQQVVSREVSAKVLVSEQQVRDFCQQDSSINYEVDVGHILRREVSAKEQETLLKLRQQLLAGEKLSKLALRYSEDPSVKNNQGRLGYIKRGQLVLAFEKIAFSLKPNQVSPPVQTRFGLHLIKVFAQRKIATTDCGTMLPQEKQRIKQTLSKQEEQRRLNNLLATLRKRSDIHVY